MTTKCYVGIDPGKQGYIAWWYDGNLFWEKIPPNFNDLFDLLNTQVVRIGDTVVGVEKATAYRGQGARSINSYLIPFGALLGFLEILDCAIHLISPRMWQSYFKIKSSIKVKKGLDKKERNKLKYRQRKELKEMSIQKAQEVWGVEVKDHNLADSLLILKYMIDKY